MPDELEVLMFQFNFDQEVTIQAPPDYDGTYSKVAAEKEMSQWLNKEADDIASDVEREVSRALRPFTLGPVTVQAEVSFRANSPLIIEGTIMALVGALGTVTAQTISQALGQNLAQLLEIPMNRLVRRWLNRSTESMPQRPSIQPFSANIQSTRTQRQAIFMPSSQEQEGPASQRESTAPGIAWLSWTTAALALLNLLLLIALFLLLMTMGIPT